DLTMGDFSNLYIYPNTLTVVKVTGEDVKNWLEVSAGQFNQITAGTNNEALFNTNFRSYNFDVINGVTYQIDVTQPARFSGGKLINEEANRIVNLEYNGEPIDLTQEFLIITNNYRTGGGEFAPVVSGDKIVLADSIENRQVITDYARELGTVTAENLLVDQNWSFVQVDNTSAVFNSATKAESQTTLVGNEHISKLTDAGDGFSTYALNLDLENESTKKTLTIMHTNDMHGRLAADSSSLGVAKLKTFVDQTQPDLLFDAGDALQGLPLSNESQGMMMLEAMNAIGYDAMAVGNHEFDFGYAQAQTYVNEANFPILASNILDKIKNESAFEQTTMFELYGIQVGVVGVATPETAEKTHPDNVVDVTFQDPYTTTQAAVDQLEADGADIIIALSHLGLDDSSTERADLLAEQVEGLDLIIDGHSHTKLTEPLVVNGTPIVQTGEYLNNVGVIE
ncbi:MAG: 5'-nucleotidase C-terminal domain-containing protein, partial [Culicoidibacterales bacterium]